MNINDLFKTPKLPMGSNKRRMPDMPTPEMLKKMKMDVDSEPSVDAPSTSARNGASARAATVEDADEDMDQDFAPGGDADYFAEEDEEGRFYGGGLSREQKDILNIFDKDVTEGAVEDLEDMNLPAVRRVLLRFERAEKKNQDQRSKYPDDPTKFIDSEADLDLALKGLIPLAQAPVVAYPELVSSGAVARLIGLLSHENPDIVIDVVEVIHELTDEDVGNGGEGEEEEEGKREEALKVLMEGLLENSILELLVDNLKRLNEAEESDRQGVFHILAIFENFIGFNAELSPLLISKTTIVTWLLTRIQTKEYDDNRGYAAELLSIALQNNRENRLALGRQEGVEIMLKVLSQYRRRDPVDADETEFMENVFDTLCSALGEEENKKLFLDSEGIDLMVLMLKEKKQSRSRSIKVLDHAMSGPAGTACCETFVEALGLKNLFSTFMSKGSKKNKTQNEDISHTLGIVSSLFSNLASDSPARIRLLTKFVENTYEKVDKLLEIRDSAQGRLKEVEEEIETEKKELAAEGEQIEAGMDDLWYLRRLEGGLFTLQTVDYILAWVAMEDDGILSHVQQMMGRRDRSLKDIVKTLQVYRDNVDENPSAKDSDEPTQKEILQHLIDFLDGC
ncbi:hypothetical protein PHLGIDRAFT_125614 [Phlebiopsis gigantea 11061_1 CR5-6]|uniref:Beta-catenin-like protein 1 N-terminal domain-containing protein n=1 Tax=Phlebiopsis gigantea (strain 11061_1 CR5-6) TaxID=745531 RepID=A0A0C3SEE0_PHLG1|nr:hypothetical protein PHLGIDRAFT_125614 [Phlebiopsis gigantea 11061_1 CR5-6]